MANSKTYGLRHLANAVNDIERTMHFYQEVFGMQTMYNEERFIQLTTPGCRDILVFEEKQSNEIGTTGGIAHSGLRSKDPKDIDEIVESVERAGGTIIDRGEFLPGSPHVFFKDLDGYEVEVWYELLQ
jgi:catechol 2,3-dioxygenase-like lactoylglutathione lyase family enzyme